MEILALLPGAAALNVVHANGDCVVTGVYHGAVTGVSEAAVRLPSCTVSPLKLAAYLGWDQIKVRLLAGKNKLHFLILRFHIVYSM